MSTDLPQVLFLCVHNAGRSQMAAAILSKRAGERVIVHSAGSAPGEVLNPAVVAAMAEWDIDISAEKPKKLTDDMARGADVIVTMGCGDASPSTPASATWTGNCPTPPASRSRTSGPFATRSRTGSMRSWRSS